MWRFEEGDKRRAHPQCRDVSTSRHPNVVTLRSYDVQATSAKVTTFQCRDITTSRHHLDSPSKNFLDITKKNEKERKGNMIRDGEDDTVIFERSCNPCTCIFFLELLLIKTK